MAIHQRRQHLPNAHERRERIEPSHVHEGGQLIRRALVLAASLVSLCACGGQAPAKDAAGSNASTAADAASPSTSGDTSHDTSGDASAAPVASAAPDAGGAAPATDAPSTAKGEIHTDDADDACSAAALALEKRARPAIKACYREGKKKDANLIGGVRLAAAVTPAGKLGNIMTSPNGDKKLLPPAVVKCMADAVKAADPGDISACKGKSLAIPVQFPSQ